MTSRTSRSTEFFPQIKAAAIFLVLACVVTAVFFRNSALAEPDLPKPDALKVGGLYGLTGPLMEFSSAYRNGAVLAAERSNTDFPTPLKLIVEDHRWDAKQALTAYKKLSSVDGVRMFQVLGSSPSIAIKPLTEANGELLFTASAYIPELEKSKGIIRHSNRGDQDALSLVEYIQAKEWKLVAGIVIENEWSNHFDVKFKESLEQRGIRYLREYHAPDASDFRAIATKVARHKPDSVVIISFGLPAGMAMKALRDLRYPGPIIGNNGFALSHDARRLVKEAKLKEIYVQEYLPPPPEFDTLYRSRFGEPAHAVAYWSYTDLEIIAAAASQVGPEPLAMARRIKELDTFQGRFGVSKISPIGEIIEFTKVVPFE